MNKLISAAEIKRDNVIDILKGICIIFMVAGHASSPISSFVYIFHMSVFFMASGFFFRTERIYSAKTLSNFIVRKILSLWLPFFAYNLFFSIFHNVFFHLNIITDNQDILNYGPLNSTSNLWSLKYTCYKIFQIFFMHGIAANFAGAFWFVKVLFFINILYSFITYLINKFISNKILFHIIIQMFLSIALCVCGFYIKKNSPFTLTLCYYSLFYLGFLLKNINLKSYICSSSLKVFLSITISFSIIYFLFIQLFHFRINLAAKTFDSPVSLIGTAFVGWVFIYSFNFFIEKIPHINFFIQTIGKNTMEILALHILAFKPIALIKVLLENRDFYLIAVFPALEPITMNSNKWGGVLDFLYIVWGYCSIAICICFKFH